MRELAAEVATRHQAADQAVEHVAAGVAVGPLELVELGDRLAGKRNEDALVFTAASTSGVEFRVLALRDAGSTVLYAVEPPASLPPERTSPV